MKKYFIVALVAIVAIASSADTWAAKTSIKLAGDSIEVVDGTDTAKIAGMGNAGKIINQVISSLGDTVIADDQAVVVDGSDGEDDEYGVGKLEMIRHAETTGRELAIILTGVVFGSIIVIILLCLLFTYLHRRAKYRMIEKAIENNYELPASITGIRPNPMSYGNPAPQNPYYGAPQRPAAPMPGAQAGSQSQFGGAQPFAGQTQQPYGAQMPPQYITGQYYMPGFNNGLRWTVIGVAGAVFFGICGADPLTGLFAIFALVGLIKIGGEYINQRNRIAYEQWQMNQPEAPANAEQPQTAAPQEQTTDHAAYQPKAQDGGDGNVTPPPFNGNQPQA